MELKPKMSDTRSFTFICETPGLRLDRFLAARLTDYSRTVLRTFIEDGKVLVDGRAQKPNFKLKSGEKIAVSLSLNSWPSLSAEDWILYEDRDIIVINKPAGIIMHPLNNSWLNNPETVLSEKEPSIAGIFYRLKPEIAKKKVNRLGIVHRLDRQTSGVLLLAKNEEAEKNLRRQFKEHLLQKTYRAITRGNPRQKRLRVNAPIGHAGMSRNFVATPFGKPAETGFKILKSAPCAALVEARPLTGRTHQIRAHLAFAGYPVAGDFLFDKESQTPAPPRLMLHAFEITLSHPRTHKEISFRAPIPDDFNDFWKLCLKKKENPL